MAYYGRRRQRTGEEAREEERIRTEASSATLNKYGRLLAEALDVDFNDVSQGTPSDTMLLLISMAQDIREHYETLL